MKKIITLLLTFIVLAAHAQDTIPTTRGVAIPTTTIGKNYLNLTNPSAITFPRMNADNTVSSRTAAQLLSDIGAVSGNIYTTDGTITGTRTINGGNNVLLFDNNSVMALYGGVSTNPVVTTLALGSNVARLNSQLSSGNTATLTLVSTGLPGVFNKRLISSLSVTASVGTNIFYLALDSNHAKIKADTVSLVGAIAASASSGDSVVVKTAAGQLKIRAQSDISGGGATPGGSNTQLQYNNSSAFGGMSKVTTNGTDLILIPGSPAYTAGLVYYDSSCNCLIFRGRNSNVTQNISQEQLKQVYNNTGSTILNGQAVYETGVSTLIAGEYIPFVALAQANSGTTTVCVGIATEDITTGTRGLVTTAGIVHGLNTSGLSGGNVFLSDVTPGGLTNTAPSAPSFRYRVGIVNNVDAVNGSIDVTPSTGALGNGTANQVFGMNNAGTAQEVKTLNGTTNRLTVSNAANSFTFDVGSLVAVKDANNNLSANSFLSSYTTTATAAGTTVLTVASTAIQYFTGATTQTVTLPVTSTLVLGQQYFITNNSTGLVTVNSSGANAVIILGAATSVTLTCILTSGTTAASWNATYFGDVVATGKKVTFNNTQTFTGTDGQTMTLPAASTTLGGLGTTQTWTGANTFNNASVLAGAATMAVFNTTATNLSIGGAATTLNIGATATAGGTHSYSTGVTASGQTKNINFANAGAAGSTTNINFGTNASTTTITMAGNTNIFHMSGGSSAPTIAAGVGAGTTPTLTVGAGSSDLSGYINITTGTTPTLSAVVGTVTFNTAYGAAPRCIMLTPANAAANALVSGGGAYVSQAATTTTTFTINSGAIALPASTALVFFYHVIQ